MKISSMKILMVHADKQERGRLAIMLARFEHSIAFTNGYSFSGLKLDTYDLIIVDEDLSDGPGFVFLKQLSSKYRAKTILMSNSDKKERAACQSSMGIYECMKKPVKPIDLAVVVCDFFVSFYLSDNNLAPLSC
jgi:DNA-binding NtrC family response regulator